MENKDKIIINIGKKGISLNVKQKSEYNIYQKTKELLEKKYEQYKEKYKNVKDECDIVKFVLIDLAFRYVKEQNTSENFDFEFLNKIENIIENIENKIYPHQEEGETQHINN